jgi:hypothetical protein
LSNAYFKFIINLANFSLNFAFFRIVTKFAEYLITSEICIYI